MDRMLNGDRENNGVGSKSPNKSSILNGVKNFGVFGLKTIRKVKTNKNKQILIFHHEQAAQFGEFKNYSLLN